MKRTSLLLVSVASVLALTATGCGSSGGKEITVPRARAESLVLKRLQADGSVVHQLECPDNAKAKVGKWISCRASYGDKGKPAPFSSQTIYVEVLNEKGDIEVTGSESYKP